MMRFWRGAMIGDALFALAFLVLLLRQAPIPTGVLR